VLNHVVVIIGGLLFTEPVAKGPVNIGVLKLVNHERLFQFPFANVHRRGGSNTHATLGVRTRPGRTDTDGSADHTIKIVTIRMDRRIP
jgi:hypothetical protein